MKRFCITVVALAVVLAAGVSHAQEKDKPVIPEKVLKSFENIIGVWNLEGKIGDVPFKGRDTIKWLPGKYCVIWNGTRKIGDAQTIHLTSLLYWDGFSEDGFISNIAYSFGGTDTVRFKVESEKVATGELTGVTFGKKSTGKIRFEKDSPNQFTLSYTERVLQGEAQDEISYIYSRVKRSGIAEREGSTRQKKSSGNKKVSNSDIAKPVVCSFILEALDGKEDVLAKKLTALVSKARSSKGCVTFNLHRDPKNKSIFMVYEIWSDWEALNAFAKTPPVQEIFETGKEFIKEDPDFEWIFWDIVK